MTLHFQREVEKIKKMILNEAAFVEDNLKKALLALKNRDVELGQAIFEADDQLDQMEIDVEEESLKILALYQPVATDLRFIIAVVKLNSDLERIGDLTSNIAGTIAGFAEYPNAIISDKIFEMADLAEQMVREAITALIEMNKDIAAQVCATDEKVDDFHREMMGYVQNKILNDMENIRFYMLQMAVSRYLERIADHATNIAEDVMYLVSGKIQRHSQNS